MSVSAVTPFNPSNYLIEALIPINVYSPFSSNSPSGLGAISESFDTQFSPAGQLMSAANTLESSAFALTQAATYTAQSTPSSGPGVPAGAASGQLAAVQTFVDAFNRLQAATQANGQATSTFGQFTAPIQGAGNNSSNQDLSALAEIGVTQNAGGNLSLNPSTFLSALQNNPSSVEDVFSNGGIGVADQILAQSGNISPSGGTWQSANSAIGNELMFNEFMTAQGQTQNVFGNGFTGFNMNSFNGQALNANFSNPTSSTLLNNLLTESTIYSLASLSAQFNVNNSL